MKDLSGVNFIMKYLAWCQVQWAANSLIYVNTSIFFFKENTFLNFCFYLFTCPQNETQGIDEWQGTDSSGAN